jgi:predicted nucleotidyltransferase
MTKGRRRASINIPSILDRSRTSVPPDPHYPSREHEQAAAAIVAFFAARDEPDTILLVNSCARGRATRDSCLDVVVLVPERTEPSALETAWQRRYATDPVYEALRRTGAFSVVRLDVHDGRLDPVPHPEDEYPDDVEITIGNDLAYSVSLWERGDRLERLRRRWLPYYDEGLRRERLAEVSWCCRHYLEHFPLHVERGLYCQSFARLWGAFRMFLQALFIARRTYPIAYDKWIREQVVEILGLPALYERLPHLFEIGRFECAELVDKAAELGRLLDAYAGE